MDSNEVLTELKEWLYKGSISVKQLYESAAYSCDGSEMSRLSEKYNTMQMVLNKIKELERQ